MKKYGGMDVRDKDKFRARFQMLIYTIAKDFNTRADFSSAPLVSVKGISPPKLFLLPSPAFFQTKFFQTKIYGREQPHLR
jgi:hypothetical protein